MIHKDLSEHKCGDQLFSPMNMNDADLAEPQPLQGIKILIVDDDIDTTELYTFILNSVGAEAIAVYSMQEALDVLNHYQPQILISDHQLQDGNGYSLIREVKNQGLDLKAVMVTGSDAIEEHERAMREGFSVYLSKPLDPETLIKVIVQLAVNHSS